MRLFSGFDNGWVTEIPIRKLDGVYGEAFSLIGLLREDHINPMASTERRTDEMSTLASCSSSSPSDLPYSQLLMTHIRAYIFHSRGNLRP